jgi:hypothetical protein
LIRNLLFSTIAILVLSIPSRAQTDKIVVWFSIDIGLELGAQSTDLSRPISTGGGGLLTEGKVYRIVTDTGSGMILFAYELEALKSEAQDAVYIRIKPIDPKIESKFFRNERISSRWGRLPDGKFPTVAAVREFPIIRHGDIVELEILRNPQTKEIIYDVLSPATGPNPCPNGHPCISARKPN